MGLKKGITMLIHNKDDIEFVTEFLCFLGHPVLDPAEFTLYDHGSCSTSKRCHVNTNNNRLDL